MPHSLYLGSGIVQPRLFEYDVENGHVAPHLRESSNASVSSKVLYQPSLPAINFCLKYSIVELAVSLFTFALFVNSAILIVAGSSLSSNPDAGSASLFSIYDLLSSSLAPAAGTIFALALLLSGISAGIVCTIAGQMVSEGALNWTIAPWLRRLITRSISITPSIVIAGAVGRDGLSATLNASQVALSIALPFVSAPLVYFTCRNKFMTVKAHPSLQHNNDHDEHEDEEQEHDSPGSTRVEGTTQAQSVTANQETGEPDMDGAKMRNHWATTTFAVLIWFVIAAMNVANLVLLGQNGGG
jgi:metal iron transporter